MIPAVDLLALLLTAAAVLVIAIVEGAHDILRRHSAGRW